MPAQIPMRTNISVVLTQLVRAYILHKHSITRASFADFGPTCTITINVTVYLRPNIHTDAHEPCIRESMPPKKVDKNWLHAYPNSACRHCPICEHGSRHIIHFASILQCDQQITNPPTSDGTGEQIISNLPVSALNDKPTSGEWRVPKKREKKNCLRPALERANRELYNISFIARDRRHANRFALICSKYRLKCRRRDWVE